MATKKAAKNTPVKQTKVKAADETPKEMVTVYIMGKAHKVPAEATIMGAIEYAGYQIKRGAGCREGFCGACATVYRLPGDYKIYTGLHQSLPSRPGGHGLYPGCDPRRHREGHGPLL